jgi:putative glutamine amidotransferase
MPPRPLVAITTTLVPSGAHGLPHVLLGAQYIAAVERFGASAVLLSPAHEPASVLRLLDLADGLVLTGGEDVDPTRYGEEMHPLCERPNPERDAMEFAALEHALRREMPVLAICRGMQLLNVARGGTLYQDLASERPGSILHEQTQPVYERAHDARVQPGTRFHAITGREELRINSFHHQGVDRLAPPLQASVWAEDGLIEAVEDREHPWVIGVQWHPERGESAAPGDRRDPDRRLLWAFVQACAERAARRSADDAEAVDLVEPEAEVIPGDRRAQEYLR